jgi:hypothetical protein
MEITMLSKNKLNSERQVSHFLSYVVKNERENREGGDQG